jgi:hypothetical protein
MRSQQNKTGSSSLPEWYQTYFLAVLEADESRMLIQIERAAKAIAERLVELRCGSPEYPEEFQDLHSALTYLGLLSDTIDPELRGSYEFNRSAFPRSA